MTKLMTLFCLLQNNSTSKSTDQKGPSLCAGMLSCPSPCPCAVRFLIEPFLMLGLLQCRKNCCCQVLCAVLYYVGLKAKLSRKFQDAGTNSSLMEWCLWHYAWDNFQAFCLLTFKYGGACGCFWWHFYGEVEKRNAGNTSTVCRCFGLSF